MLLPKSLISNYGASTLFSHRVSVEVQPPSLPISFSELSVSYRLGGVFYQQSIYTQHSRK